MDIQNSISSVSSFYLEKIQVKKQRIVEQQDKLKEDNDIRISIIDLNKNISALSQKSKDIANESVENVQDSVKEFVKNYTDVLSQMKEYSTNSNNKYDSEVLLSEMRNILTDKFNDNDKSLSDIGINFKYDNNSLPTIDIDEKKLENNSETAKKIFSSLSTKVEDIAKKFAKDESSSLSSLDKKTESKQKYILRLQDDLDKEMQKIDDFMDKIQQQQNMLSQMSLMNSGGNFNTLLDQMQ